MTIKIISPSAGIFKAPFGHGQEDIVGSVVIKGDHVQRVSGFIELASCVQSLLEFLVNIIDGGIVKDIQARVDHERLGEVVFLHREETV